MWCFEVGKSISEFSGAVKALFRSGLSPVFWKAFLPSILKFVSKHGGDGSAMDLMQGLGEGSCVGGGVGRLVGCPDGRGLGFWVGTVPQVKVRSKRPSQRSASPPRSRPARSTSTTRPSRPRVS